uniref:carbohydrate sulfotransferase 1 n=1 Tax=Myxine glutinosa TaxID=7769 RepID=UPI00358DE1BE
MEVSWRIVVLLLLTLLVIQYTAIRTLHLAPNLNYAQSTSCVPRSTENLNDSSRVTLSASTTGGQKHIVVFAVTRSGSSFLGQLLNHQSDAFYLFEPLYHVQKILLNSSIRLRRTISRRALVGAFIDLLRNLFFCDVQFLRNYDAVKVDRLTLFRRAASRALCIPPVCTAVPQTETYEEESCSKYCGANLNLTLAQQVCRKTSNIVIKIVRMPEIGDLRTLAVDPRLDLRIIHLVRDPRAIIASRMKAFGESFRSWKVWKAVGRMPYNLDKSVVTTVCYDLLSSISTVMSTPEWLKGKYMLVRHEDLSLNPIEKAKEIYKFVGIPMENEVKKWILKNTKDVKHNNSNIYATVRNSSTIVDHWRSQLSFDMVQLIQTLCSNTMVHLGYKFTKTPAELRNLSISMLEENFSILHL